MNPLVSLSRGGCLLLVRLMTGARGLWLGGEIQDDRPRVYFANHGSHLDFVALWAALPDAVRRKTRPVAALDYWGRGRLREWIARSVFRAALIDRRKVTRENHPVRQMLEILDSGESIILFPEGTRSRSGEMAEFKSGLFHLARQVPHVEFVPVLLQNLNRVLPRGELLPIPILSTISFGPSLKWATGETRDAFLARARDAVLAMRPEHGAVEPAPTDRVSTSTTQSPLKTKSVE